jgi:hypothetical protein
MKHGCLFFALVIFLSPVFIQAQEAELGVIREITGTVEVKTPASPDWVPAARGMQLAKSSSISTGIRSTAVIALGNSTITVRPLTRLTLEELVRNQDTEQVDIRLRSGRVRTEVAPPTEGKTNFTVRSPSATASVRGTSFELDTERVRVLKGRVNFSGSDGVPSAVKAGESSAIDQTSGNARSAAELTAARLAPALPAGADKPASSNSSPSSGRGILGIKLDWYKPNSTR